MLIGINATFFATGKGGGIERAVRCMISALGKVAPNHQFILFTGRDNRNSFSLPKNVMECSLHVPSRNRFFKVLCEQLFLPIAAYKNNLDALIAPGNFASLACPCPQIVIIHDCVPWASESRFSTFEKIIFKTFFLFSGLLAKAIITPSQFTKTEAIQFLRLNPKKVFVAHEAGSHLRSSFCANSIIGSYILCVISDAPHKNADGILSAYRILQHKYGIKTPLILIGVSNRPGHDGIIFRKFVSNNTLRALYSGATVAVMPSFYEGYGLAAAEALCAGVPLIASHIPALLETAEMAAIYFDPYSPDDIACKLASVLTNTSLANSLSLAGKNRSNEFSWDCFTTSIINVVNKIVDDKIG